MPSVRKNRLEDRIKRIVSEILLAEMRDPRMGFTTITGAELSKDNMRVKIKVSVLGDEKDQAVTLNVLEHARGYVQKLLGERLSIRFLPAVSFELDDSIKRSIALSKAIRDSGEKTDGGQEDQ